MSSTSSVLSTIHPPPNSKSLTDFYIGLTMAVTSACLNGASFILKKKGLLNLANRKHSTRAGDGGHEYVKEPLWWLGLATMGVGEGLNFAAYAFAPATLVTPLGGISVLVSAVMSSNLLKERLNLLGKLGCLICVLGSTFIVLHAPKEQEVESVEVLSEKMLDPAFITFCFAVLIATLILVFHYAPRCGQTNVLIYVCICSLVGGITVLGCKGLGTAIKESITTGHNKFVNWVAWLCVLVVVFCIVVQINYLNKALDTFNTAVVTPIYYVVFTSCVIFASALLFKEWVHISFVDAIGTLAGFLITVVGIFLVSAFRSWDISLNQVIHVNQSQARLGRQISASSALLSPLMQVRVAPDSSQAASEQPPTDMPNGKPRCVAPGAGVAERRVGGRSGRDAAPNTWAPMDDWAAAGGDASGNALSPLPAALLPQQRAASDGLFAPLTTLKRPTAGAKRTPTFGGSPPL